MKFQFLITHLEALLLFYFAAFKTWNAAWWCSSLISRKWFFPQVLQMFSDGSIPIFVASTTAERDLIFQNCGFIAFLKPTGAWERGTVGQIFFNVFLLEYLLSKHRTELFLISFECCVCSLNTV